MNLASVHDVTAVLAEQETRGPEFGKASPLGLLVIVVLLVATFLLIRSMNSQLRKLPESFDTENPEADQAFDEGTEPRAAEHTDGESAGPESAGRDSTATGRPDTGTTESGVRDEGNGTGS
ncbi:hypothetical protein [Gordonia zhaorongruii]|uniref:hypothetical protein n=1 Tax=Gordonia zhaorongruii TaxID=2597659 RepID=UPI001F3AC85C|nr:hypothetical protein [Gordonia zhaorongruii]